MKWLIPFVCFVSLGCNPCPDFPNLSKEAGYKAPADFTRGVGETKFFQSSDGKTVFWEIPYYNDTKSMMFCTAAPAITVKDDKGKIVWRGQDNKSWSIQPGEQGHVGGKIVIPDEALKPVLRWEQGGTPSAEFKGEVSK